MSILRVEKRTGPFVVLDKQFLENTCLSWKARGLLAYLLSLPDNWSVNVRDLVKRAPDGRDALYSGLKELERGRYILREEVRGKDGCYQGLGYVVFEVPQSPDPENPYPDKNSSKLDQKNTQEPLTENPDPGFPDPVNPPLINKQYKQITSINKKTAAEGAVEQTSQPLSVVAAAGYKNHLSAQELVLGKALTSGQQEMIRKMVVESHPHLPSGNFEEQVEHVCTVMCDPKSFTQAGSDFLKKLNTIRKVIRGGGWTIPAKHVIALQREEEAARKAIHAKLQVEYYEIAHCERMLSYAESFQSQGKAANGLNVIELAERREKALSEIERLNQRLEQMDKEALLSAVEQQKVNGA